MWAYFDSAGNGVSGYFKLDQDANNYLEFVYRHLSGDHCALSFHIQSGGSLLLDITGPGVTALVDNAWHHLAVIRNGASTYITLDGVVKASGASVTCPAFTGYARIGDTGAGARHLFTYADEFRISKFARWTSFPFSPPTVPYDESYSGATVVTSVPLQTVISLHASQEINSPMEITAVPLVAALSLQAASARGSNMMIQTLPALLGAGTLASRSGRLNAILPILTISADGKAGEVEILDSVLPSLRMSGTGLSGALGTLGVTLPVLSIVATGGLQRSAVATISLPFFYINAHGETKQALPICPPHP